ncbi:RNA polymerase sigma factor [Amycolatopsis sp.]|jgi:RNA polymerase sigma factor (sigma-70 family)|uniref:RNA polymerase sigma factor n=1 Tax=Amycolatopsis sp. TaxID=37632 RepID=UPI002E0A3170|nr:sigma-70 family RNA polymerase sigma factor [Amycolatopsis sp.]
MTEGIDFVRTAAVRHCRSAGATAEDAEDSAQDALVSLLESPEAPVRRPGAWIVTVSHRRWVDHLRRDRREHAVLRHEQAMSGGPVDPAEVVADRDQARWLVASLKKLPETTQEICLAVGRGASREEVAQAFGISPRAVESHLTRARRMLRRLRTIVVIPVVAVVDRLARRWPGVPDMAAAVVPVVVGVAVTMYPPPMHLPPPEPVAAAREIVKPAEPVATPSGAVPAAGTPTTSVLPPPPPPSPTAVPAVPAAKSPSATAKPQPSGVSGIPKLTTPQVPDTPKRPELPGLSKLPELPVTDLPTLPAIPPVLPPIAPGDIIGSVINGLPIKLPVIG